jgi:hypothetical protein
MSELKEKLLDFIEWVKDNAEDAFDLYEDPEKLIDKYLEKNE